MERGNFLVRLSVKREKFLFARDDINVEKFYAAMRRCGRGRFRAPTIKNLFLGEDKGSGSFIMLLLASINISVKPLAEIIRYFTRQLFKPSLFDSGQLLIFRN